jgi:hypothetical protein
MRHSVLAMLFCFVVLVLVGCKKHEAPPPVPRSQAQIDVWGLITSKKIETGSGIAY